MIKVERGGRVGREREEMGRFTGIIELNFIISMQVGHNGHLYAA